MGIYIPGIDMPDSCDNCFICNRCEGNCNISDADYLPNKRPDVGMAVELPPHGDLVDRSKIRFTDFEIVMCDGDFKQGLKMLAEKIENAISLEYGF